MKASFTLLMIASIGCASAWGQPARSPLQAVHYIKLANTLREVDKSQESINLLLRAMPAVQSKNAYWTAVANELLGLAYKDIRDSTAALRYLERARSQYAKLKYVASGWAVNEVIRDLSGKNLYAGLQIGATGVRVAIFKTKYESDFYEKDVKTTFDIPNASPLLYADVSNSYKPGQNALRIGLDSIRRYNIPDERIFIVFSSDVNQGLTRMGRGRQVLYQQLAQTLSDRVLRIDTTFTPAREAELFTIGTIPRKVWPSTSALNLGDNQTTGGYFDQAASRRNLTHADKAFHPITLPVGTSTLINRIESRRPLNMDAFRREAPRIVKAVADSVLRPYANDRDAGLQQHQTVGLGGDVALALITYLHPDRAGVAAVPISVADVEQFKQAVLTDYKSVTRPNLESLESPRTRSQAEDDLKTVQQLSEKQLIAGVLWLSEIMNAYNSGASPKRFVFVRNAGISWVTGKFLETINGEYESTIAKGAMYTR